MIRKLLFILLPFLAPFVLYALYVLLARRARAKGRRWDQTPWFWLTAAGLAGMIVSLGTLAFIDGAPPGATYEPAVVKDGEIVPGRFE